MSHFIIHSLIQIEMHNNNNNNEYVHRQIGVDPGTVNFSIALIEFKGLEFNPETVERTPLLKPLYIEKWNLKSGYAKTASLSTLTNKIEYKACRDIPKEYLEPSKSMLLHQKENGILNKEIDICLSRLNYFISDSDWLFEEYSNNENENVLPSMTVENQFDHIQSEYQRLDMYLVSNTMITSLQTIDLMKYNSLYKRQITKSSLKYGMSNKGKLSYKERKEKVVEIMCALLTILGFTQWVDIILDKKNGFGDKPDDPCDALSLSLQRAIDRYVFLMNHKDIPPFDINEYVSTKMSKLPKQIYNKKGNNNRNNINNNNKTNPKKKKKTIQSQQKDITPITKPKRKYTPRKNTKTMIQSTIKTNNNKKIEHSYPLLITTIDIEDDISFPDDIHYNTDDELATTKKRKVDSDGDGVNCNIIQNNICIY